MAKKEKAVTSDKKDINTLKADILSLKRELLNLRFQRVSGELTNTARFKEVRKHIARNFTEIRKLSQNS